MPYSNTDPNNRLSATLDPNIYGLDNGTRDDRAYNSGLGLLHTQINDRRYREYLDRTQQMKDLNTSFNAPAREKYYGSLYNAALQQGLGQAQDNAQHQYRNAEFNAADRGVLGGSSDINKRAGVGRALDYASVGAATDAQNFSNQYRKADEDKRVNLLRLIQSGDPASQAAIAQQLHGISDVTNQGLVNEQLQQLANQQRQAYQNSQSQLIGNAIAWGGTQYGIDQNARGSGGRGLGWVPQFGYSNNSGVGST